MQRLPQQLRDSPGEDRRGKTPVLRQPVRKIRSGKSPEALRPAGPAPGAGKLALRRRAPQRRQTRPHRHPPDHVLPGTHALLPDLLRGSGLHRGLLTQDQQEGDQPGDRGHGGGALLPGEGGPRPHPGPLKGRGQAHLPAQPHRPAPPAPRDRQRGGLSHGPIPDLHRAYRH